MSYDKVTVLHVGDKTILPNCQRAQTMTKTLLAQTKKVEKMAVFSFSLSR